MQGIQVQSLVRELRSHMPCTVQPNNKINFKRRFYQKRNSLILSLSRSIMLTHMVLNMTAKQPLKAQGGAFYSIPFGRKITPESLNSSSAVHSAAQSPLALCNPTDCGPPGSSVHGILQENPGVGCHSLLQEGIFPTQGLNPHLLYWQADSLPSEPPEDGIIYHPNQDT